MSIKLLDCTLRDGGHQNGSLFGEEVIRSIIRGLDCAKVDYIEIGFLREKNVGFGYSASDSIENFESRFCGRDDQCRYAVMIQEDQYPIHKLPDYCGGPIGMIRVSFHDYDKGEGLDYCREVIRKGYHVSVNPINIAGYTDMEILEMISAANAMGADVFTVVDTFGALTKDDLMRLHMLLDHNLREDICLGFHFHDNLQMAYTLAQSVVEIASGSRDIIVDASLLGMGREPGNLCIELMMSFLNRKKASHYDVDIALDLIDQYIQEFKKKYPWGYETVYSLSAQYKLHRSYAEYLMKKQKLKVKQIRHILGQISEKYKSRYDEAYVEKLYRDFVATDVDDSYFREKLRSEIGNREVILIAPGHTLPGAEQELKKRIKTDCFLISANFVPDTIETDYVFCTNLKRLGFIMGRVPWQKLMIGAFMKDECRENQNILNTNELGRFGEIYWDNCMLMLMHLMKDIGIKNISVAGWDGFSAKNNFYNDQMESVYNYEDENIKVIQILKNYFYDVHIEFITESIYEKAFI
ncbi:MAG TPA: 4-hydroxy-2-ketovalerate aldolase [Lachnospiraceae bacterium]|nr:4-hydroxy-2-ketovalerate aldolase [Lachnospiraceae bacterium]